MKAYVRLARPQQWIKNLFLFAPLIFSRHLFEQGFLRTELFGVAVFCLLSSAVYVVNDIADRKADRLHPVKRSRPIASGAVGIGQGIIFALLLLVAAAGIGWSLDPKFRFIALLYFALNLAYSFWLKQLLLVDVFVIAAGFMLRVLAGAFVINVEVSHWLVLCTLFVSVFLAISKRRAEIILNSAAESFSTRPVLREYDIGFIDQIMTVAASGMAISYALYTVADRTVTMFGTENLIFSTVFVLFGIFRYLYLVRKFTSEDNPTSLLFSDIVMIINVLAWFATCVVIIYWSSIFS